MTSALSKADLSDVSDSSDWLGTPLALFAAVEAALRCHVCKDFYTTPMITSCSHTFCSICIRRCLSNDGKCPTCRALDQELKLRSNWDMETAVDAFQRARQAGLEYARTPIASSQATRSKRKVLDTESAVEGGLQARKRTRSSSRKIALSYGDETHLLLDSDEDEDEQPDDGLVACPCCTTRMKVEKVDSHLDSCTGIPLENRKPKSPPSKTMALNSNISTSHNPTFKPQRLPSISYGLLKDNPLRKKLAELGISSAGNRQQLIQRHMEWVTIWNSNCDSQRPRKKSELLQDLEVWERTQGMRAPSSSGLNPGAFISSKSFDGASYSAKHDASFQTLIEEARRKAKQAAKSERTLVGDNQKGRDVVANDGEDGQARPVIEEIRGEQFGTLSRNHEPEDHESDIGYENNDGVLGNSNAIRLFSQSTVRALPAVCQSEADTG